LLAYGFLAAYISAAIGLSAIVGAFAAGLPLSSRQIKVRMVLQKTKSLYMFFVPILFISIGTLVNLRIFGQAAFLGLVITAMAFIGKILGSFMAARMTRFSTRESLKIGISMTPRGEMGLIIASLGLTSGLISTGTYSVAVMAVILTTFIALPIIKKVYETKITRFPIASEIYASFPRIPKRKIKDKNTEEKNKMTEQ